MNTLGQFKENHPSFISNHLETTFRLLQILSKIYNNESIKNCFVLRGGSAVSFYLPELKRLFLDIDIDFKTKEIEHTKEEREEVIKNIDSIMKMLDYDDMSSKSRHSYSLDSLCYSYLNKAGNLDYIKMDINYSMGRHLYSDNIVDIEELDHAKICLLNLEELIAMKLKSLFERTSIKDLFDIFMLIKTYPLLDTVRIRKSYLFYYTLSALELEPDCIYRLKDISKKDMIAKLYPLIEKRSGYQLEIMKEKVEDFAKEILQFTKEELEFCSAFYQGEYCPELLFKESETIAIAKQNAIACYKTNLKKRNRYR